jgi:hypothetical protein
MRPYLKFLLSLYSAITLLNSSQPNTPPSSDESIESKEEDTSLNTKYALLQWVDKVTGRFKLIDAPVGKTISNGQLKIKVSVCRQSAPFETPESKAFVTIWEYPKESLPKKLFSGWMLASSPVVSTLINHPRYNVWLTKCTNKKINLMKKTLILSSN